MIQLGICGASGKMGQRLISLLNSGEFPNLKPSTLLTSSPSSIVPSSPYKGISFETMKDIDVFIDFSQPIVFSQFLPILRELRKPAVIGTTGFSQKQEIEIKELATIIPIVFTPNTSIGVNVLFQLVQRAAQLLPKDFTPHILEIHHSDKQDAPSGTARQLQKEIKSFRNESVVSTDSIRGGDVIGEHIISFIGFGERLELTHRATSRDIFARGALKAAEWIVDKKPRLYTMQDILGK